MCDACLASLRPDVSAHSMLRSDVSPHLLSLGPYAGVTRRLVKALKFDGSREVASRLASVLAPSVPAAWNVQVVTSVPLHASRERERGYNQADVLAREVAARLGVPSRLLLRRVRRTRQQARLRGAARSLNVEGAFEATERAPRRVLLVDDVLTTSRTLGECARTLRAAGATDVYVLVLAR
ncbi:ComF family protein [Deinococcus yavapaiensis KR-236]|uniref:ComF family protein n=1 Tax=Deinococcus yavapaiensis KR-236 TaxID=694435 RepID=A0A318S9S7_9DEIO|nr:ComF family protein [Deinococcus yavapaiensis KR-236]